MDEKSSSTKYFLKNKLREKKNSLTILRQIMYPKHIEGSEITMKMQGDTQKLVIFTSVKWRYSENTVLLC